MREAIVRSALLSAEPPRRSACRATRSSCRRRSADVQDLIAVYQDLAAVPTMRCIWA
jgi:hypothetical protein